MTSSGDVTNTAVTDSSREDEAIDEDVSETPKPKATKTPKPEIPSPATRAPVDGSETDRLEAIEYVQQQILPPPFGTDRLWTLRVTFNAMNSNGGMDAIGWDAEPTEDVNGDGWLVYFLWNQADKAETQAAIWYYNPKTGVVAARNEHSRFFDTWS